MTSLLWLGSILVLAPLTQSRHRHGEDSATDVRTRMPRVYPPSYIRITPIRDIIRHPGGQQELTTPISSDLPDMAVIDDRNRTETLSVSDTNRSRSRGNQPKAKRRHGKRRRGDRGQRGSLQAAGNPLRDQPNFSVGRESASKGAAMVVGSRNAFTATKMNLKKEWCQTQPMRQVVREPGCLRTSIVNKFCYGQCNSFYIPRWTKQAEEINAFESCTFCRPRRGDSVLVTMRCPGQRPRIKRKRIYVIKQCKCMAQTINE